MNSPAQTASGAASERMHPAPRRRRWLWLLAILLVFAVCILRWGRYILVAPNHLPAHADAAIVLQGSITGEKARLDGALQLAQKGMVDRVMVSVPPQSYWGQAIPPIALQFIERTYGAELAARVDFCVVGPEVDSTEQEAEALIPCIQEHGWGSVIVVTSNYHTRRAGVLWRRQMRKRDPSARLAIDGVPDPDFRPQGWWRDRRSAKTWFLEFIKLIWMLVGG
jgi:uncharacterized SAM-binding protein YcdF (DUF218 family)